MRVENVEVYYSVKKAEGGARWSFWWLLLIVRESKFKRICVFCECWESGGIESFMYKNKENQLKLVNDFFELFETYFFGWKTTIRKTGAKTKIEYRYNAFRSDLSKMQKFINQPILVKKLHQLTAKQAVLL